MVANFSIDIKFNPSYFKKLGLDKKHGFDDALDTAIDHAIHNAKQAKVCSIIVLDTIKGYGVPCFEKPINNHHIKINTPALKEELEAYINKEEV